VHRVVHISLSLLRATRFENCICLYASEKED
jgi:hypothetical protein